MNVCHCGAMNGYQHHSMCPFPLFNNNSKLSNIWQSKWNSNVAQYAANLEEQAKFGAALLENQKDE